MKKTKRNPAATQVQRPGAARTVSGWLPIGVGLLAETVFLMILWFSGEGLRAEGCFFRHICQGQQANVLVEGFFFFFAASLVAAALVSCGRRRLFLTPILLFAPASGGMAWWLGPGGKVALGVAFVVLASVPSFTLWRRPIEVASRGPLDAVQVVALGGCLVVEAALLGVTRHSLASLGTEANIHFELTTILFFVGLFVFGAGRGISRLLVAVPLLFVAGQILGTLLAVSVSWPQDWLDSAYYAYNLRVLTISLPMSVASVALGMAWEPLSNRFRHPNGPGRVLEGHRPGPEVSSAS